MTILTVPNAFKYENGKGNNDFSSHVYKAILLNDTFVFDKDAHGFLADVASYEISSAGGYAEITLTPSTAWNQDNTEDTGSIRWSNITFTASTGNFDAFCALIVYNDSHASDLIIGCAEFEETIEVNNGYSFQLQLLGFDSL